MLLSTDFRQFEQYLNVTGLDVWAYLLIQVFLSNAFVDGCGRKQLPLPYAKGKGKSNSVHTH